MISRCRSGGQFQNRPWSWSPLPLIWLVPCAALESLGLPRMRGGYCEGRARLCVEAHRGGMRDDGRELEQGRPQFAKGREEKLKKNINLSLLTAVKAWTRLTRKAVQSPLLEAFRIRLDKALSTLVCDLGCWAHRRLN